MRYYCDRSTRKSQILQTIWYYFRAFGQFSEEKENVKAFGRLSEEGQTFEHSGPTFWYSGFRVWEVQEGSANCFNRRAVIAGGSPHSFNCYMRYGNSPFMSDSETTWKLKEQYANVNSTESTNIIHLDLQLFELFQNSANWDKLNSFCELMKGLHFLLLFLGIRMNSWKRSI